MHKSPNRKALLILQEIAEVITWFHYLEEIWMFGSSCGFVSFFDITSENLKLQISVEQLWELGVVPGVWAKWGASERWMGIKSKKDKMLFSPIPSLQIVPNTIAPDPSPLLILETGPLLSECWRKRKIFIACVVEDPSHHACGQVHLDYIFRWILQNYQKNEFSMG